VKYSLIILISFLLLFSSIFISCSSTDNTTTTPWTQQLGTTSGDYGFSVTSDSSDNIYVTGYASRDLDGNTKSGNGDIFVVKYDSSGTPHSTK
jgi:hypothetical protein